MKNWRIVLSDFLPAWVEVIKETFDQIATEHPQWQECELTFTIRHKFAQISSVSIKCENEAFRLHLVGQFGERNAVLSRWSKYNDYPISHRLNTTCESCGAMVSVGKKVGFNHCETCSTLEHERPRQRVTSELIRNNELGQWE